MIVAAAIGWDVLAGVGVGLAAVALTTGALFLASSRQQRRVKKLAGASLSFDSMLKASLKARDSEAELIRQVLESAVKDVASDQGLQEGLVSGAIFEVRNGALTIIPRQTVNVPDEEARLEIQSGDTGVGEAAKTKQPVITVFQSPFDQSTIQDPQQRQRINPDLRWIIAVPILGAESKVLWVLSIAGLVVPRSQAELHSSVGRLLYYRELLELLLREIANKSK